MGVQHSSFQHSDYQDQFSQSFGSQSPSGVVPIFGYEQKKRKLQHADRVFGKISPIGKEKDMYSQEYDLYN